MMRERRFTNYCRTETALKTNKKGAHQSKVARGSKYPEVQVLATHRVQGVGTACHVCCATWRCHATARWPTMRVGVLMARKRCRSFSHHDGGQIRCTQVRVLFSALKR